MKARKFKGLEIAVRMRITFKGGFWIVPSQSGKGEYKVRLGESPSCTCEDFQLIGQLGLCKHIHAARFVLERDYGGKAPKMDTDTPPKKKTYPQNWPCYHRSQIEGKHRFQILLHELCQGV